MEKILISACLFGEKVRYDGNHTLLEDADIQKWIANGRFIPICPEVAGGLPVPRAPCERDLVTGHILDKDGSDYSAEFDEGAEIALNLAKRHNIRFALLKERSPSCGVNLIYDGSFSSQKIAGQGITAARLAANGIKVYSEFDLERLKADLQEVL